ncbi:calcium-binding protein [Campylobacter sp. RM12647]|uniref:calcium-binding protein n=1 Tax=Campylobacter sp. RM12647 TaxID=2735737 RepID=UPI001D8EA3C2|nr:calcium-binding protein [Campylobacter sp. RM12647]
MKYNMYDKNGASKVISAYILSKKNKNKRYEFKVDSQQFFLKYKHIISPIDFKMVDVFFSGKTRYGEELDKTLLQDVEFDEKNYYLNQKQFAKLFYTASEKVNNEDIIKIDKVEEPKNDILSFSLYSKDKFIESNDLRDVFVFNTLGLVTTGEKTRYILSKDLKPIGIKDFDIQIKDDNFDFEGGKTSSWANFILKPMFGEGGKVFLNFSEYSEYYDISTQDYDLYKNNNKNSPSQKDIALELANDILKSLITKEKLKNKYALAFLNILKGVSEIDDEELVINEPGFSIYKYIENNLLNLDMTHIKYFDALLSDYADIIYRYLIKTIHKIQYDPLVLDLNNNGTIDTITLNNSKAFFDHNNDNIAYKSSWISKDDGLLVLDKNNNNLIDNGNELFGNFTEIPSSDFKALDTNNNQTLNPTQTTLALNGFEALKLLDSNKDGVIDINDKEFNNLKVWQDLNEDGITQINELKSLKDLNITSINLNYKDTNQKLDNDNTITQTATFIKDDKESLLADINFSVSSIERVFKDKIKYSEEELNLANLKGYGVLRDLRDAACLDTKLKALLKDYSSTNSKEEQLNKLDSLIYAWANTNKALNKDFNLSKTKEFDSNNPSNTDNIRDLWLTPSQAREYANFTISESLKNEFNELKQKISIINSFLGVNNQDFYIASLNEFNELRNSFNNTYDSLRTYVYKGLLFQTRLKEYYDEISITSYENNGSYELKLDFSKSIEKFKAINETNPKKAFVDLAEFITSFKDINSLNDCVILLGDFIKTMNNYTLSDYLKLLDEDTINALSTQTGTSGNDTLVGTNLLNGKDTLYGLDGDDTLIGGIGDDTLVGGNGNDTYVFDKDFGHDTIINYKSNLNDIDCIKFNDASINANNLKYVRNYDDLMLIKDDNNSIRVKDFFAYEDLRNTIDEIKFANNTSINKDEIINRVYTPTNGDDNFTMFFTNKDYVITMLDGNDTIITHNGDDIIDGGDGDDIIRSGAGADIINGGNGNDDIYAGDGDDIIIGGAGDDILQGGMGNDKYIYKGVWGKDTIINLRNDNAYDEIILDVSSSFVKITRNNDDLIINKLKSAGWFRKVVDESSSIKVVDFFKKDYDISALVLQDKTLSANDLRQMVLTPTWGNDTLIGSEYSDKIYGLFGNDTLIGGKGDDYLDGGAGNDTYIFNRNDGNDYIKDALGYDTIKFNDISFSEVVLKKDVDNLIIKYNNNKDSVTILGNFGIGFNKIEKFVFSDKTLCYDEFINTAAKELPSYEDLVNKVIKPDLSSYLKNTERLIQDTNAYSPNSSGFITYTDDKNNNIQVYL